MKKEIQETGLFARRDLSPAARRRMEQGKRRPSSQGDKYFSDDMEDQLIMEALASYSDDNWTESLRLKAEILERQDREFDRVTEYKRVNRSRNTEYQEERRVGGERRRVDRGEPDRRQGNKGEPDRRQGTKREPERRQGNKRNETSQEGKMNQIPHKKDRLGMMLCHVQLFATLIFLLCLVLVNVLPYLYTLVIAIVLLILVACCRSSQGIRKKHRFWGKVGSSTCTFFLLLGAYYCVITLLLLHNIHGENTSNTNLSKETYSVYISGIDVYGDVDSSSRSDVNLIATINPKSGEVLLTTTPRDYYVEIPGVSGGELDKLTHAGNHGIETSMATLEQLYGIDIDFYIRVNFTSFINIIDALGGVTVDSEIAFTTSKNAGHVVDIVEGENKLNGEEALAFVRERYNVDGGDNQRGKNQQIMLEAIYRKLASPMTLVNMERVLACISEDVQTNMKTVQLQQMSRGILWNVLSMNIHSVAATGTTEYAYCYSYPKSKLSVMKPDQGKLEEIKGYMEDVHTGARLPKE